MIAIRWTDAAQTDLFEAVEWYEKRSIQTGRRLARLAKQVEGKISENPRHFPFSAPTYRRATIPRFPYQIHYAELLDEVVIVAFWHEKKDRRKLLARLRKAP
jgi:toxin ParE1/3/4